MSFKKIFFLSMLFISLPVKTFAYVPHEYSAIYPHQIARLFLFISLLVVAWAILKNHLQAYKGWRFIFLAVICFAIWDITVFISRIAEVMAMPETVGAESGIDYFKRSIIIRKFEVLYYIGRLDFVLLNIAMFSFYLGLREYSKSVESFSYSPVIILPLLPILLNDLLGNIVFIILAFVCFYKSIELYRSDKENILRNYFIWLSSSWLIFSLSRAFGHIMRHILIPTGNKEIWTLIEPYSGSLNSLAIFFIGSVSIFFLSIYKSYSYINEDRRKLQHLVEERTIFVEQLEKDKIELQKLDKLKSAFLANMSHELRTPMNIIIGYTDVLLDKIDGSLTNEQENSLIKIKENSKRLLQLIDDLISISRLESAMIELNIKESDINFIIEDVLKDVKSLIEKKSLSLTLNLDRTLPSFYCDEEKIRHVILNLLSNAVKFTHKGGITVSSRFSDWKVSERKEPQYLEVCIEDTGIGIKEEDLGKIFDKFVQVDFSLIREYEGSGVGLSVAKGFIKLHKGMIWVSSKYGQGSRFCFALPLKKELLK